ncbi:MAG: transcription elongation factor Spt5 [Desulfurococcaceae archaeon]
MSSKATYYAIKVTGGREIDVALLIESRSKALGQEVYSIAVLPELKGYLVVETTGLEAIYNVTKELKYLKKGVPRKLSFSDIELFIKPKPVIELIKEGDLVEVIAGPFKGMRAVIVSIDRAKNDVELNILESEFPLTIKVPGDYVRVVRSGEG